MFAKTRWLMAAAILMIVGPAWALEWTATASSIGTIWKVGSAPPLYSGNSDRTDFATLSRTLLDSVARGYAVFDLSSAPPSNRVDSVKLSFDYTRIAPPGCASVAVDSVGVWMTIPTDLAGFFDILGAGTQMADTSPLPNSSQTIAMSVDVRYLPRSYWYVISWLPPSGSPNWGRAASSGGTYPRLKYFYY